MCGIAGQISLSKSKPDREIVGRMLASLHHRGPDSQGIHEQGAAILGNARLRIIDPDGGAQPISNEDGNLWITFNGEIFNYVELRELLLRRGHKFSTRTDTEVILHLFEDEGEACVHRLNGQWAFAIWDQRTGKLFLSRDRLGIRPLFYTKTPAAFLFASEVKALFSDPQVRREIDIDALNEIFTFWCTLSPRTAFEGVYQLPPGHSLWLSGGLIECKQYWSIDYAPQPAEGRDVPSGELLQLLRDAVRLRLRADVPIGASVSGGLDSTLIAALARQESATRLRTFSVAFESPEFDESSFQDDAVRFLGTDHTQVMCKAEDIQAAFPEVIRHTEMPVLRTAPAPMFLLSKVIRESGIKVVLTGEGADEIFGGYDIFKEAKVRRFWAAQPHSRLRPLLLRRLYPYLAKLQAQPEPYLQAFFRPRGASHLFSHQPRWEMTSRLKLFFSQSVRERLAGDPIERLNSILPEGFSAWKPLSQAEYLESAVLLPGYILSSQGDRMSMAHSVEGRYPFLDPNVVQFASRLPASWKLKVLNEKFILKRAAKGLVPESIRSRFKQPYRAPEADCFFRPKRAEYLDELLSTKSLASQGLFHPPAVAELVRKFETGTAIGVKDNMAMVGIISTSLLVKELCRR